MIYKFPLLTFPMNGSIKFNIYNNLLAIPEYSFDDYNNKLNIFSMIIRSSSFRDINFINYYCPDQKKYLIEVKEFLMSKSLDIYSFELSDDEIMYMRLMDWIE